MKIKYRYTYRLTRPSDGAFYTGSRSAATCPPEEDFGTHYFTSGVLEKEFRANPEQFTWKIHSEDYADDVAMQEDEQRLILESWDEPGRMNRSAYPVVFEMDEEWREKNAEAAKKRALSPEYREKCKEAARRSAQNPEHQKNRAEAATKRALSPEGRAHMIAANLKSRAPAVRKKMSEAATKREARKRAARLNGTEAEVDRMTRKKQSEAGTKRRARQRAARLANEDTLPFDQPRVPVKKNRG